jgi:nanoRNase/pAp phosphatase (c-di-AMP/oligoRNAs hydrolase)
LGGLKKLYEVDKELYASKPIINIDRHANNAQYGQINLVDGQAASTSEIVARVLSNMGVKLTQDIAFNLLNGVYGATNNFQSPTVTASAFELAAVCIKAGGKRFQPHGTKQEEAPVGESAATKPPVEEGKVEEKNIKPTEAPAEWLKPKIFKSSSLS